MSGKLARKSQIGPPRRLERAQGRGLAVIIGVFHQIGENHKALAGAFGNQIVTAREMSVDGRGCHARRLGCL